jgi:hypothetical protein
MQRTRFLVVALALATLAAAGCGGGRRSPTDVAFDDVSFVSLSPADGTRLTPGSTVTVSGTVRYELNNLPSGFIVLVIQDQNSHLLTADQPAVATTDRQGTATLSHQVTVPATGVTQVRVFFVLANAALISTPTNAQATYPVG